jgi:hypothetical protein
VPEVDDLLDAERNRRRPAAGRARIALIITGAVTVVALGTGATLAATATAFLVEHEAESSLVEYSSPTEQTTSPTIEPSASAVVPSPTAPTAPAAPAAPPAEAQPARSEFGIPFFDASTDIATIPRPADDHDPASTEIWLTQQGIIADCMLEKGFEYRFTVYWLIPPEAPLEARIAALGGVPAGTAEFAALHGVTEFGPDDPAVAPEYRWEDAGCHGYAVHVTGMDDAH